VLHTVYKPPVFHLRASCSQLFSLGKSQLTCGQLQHASGMPTASFTKYVMQTDAD